ncbi:N-6 DNA methylase [Geopseudomonas aromaticivorans]
MNEKIFSQLLDATRGIALSAPQSTSLVLQLLCWWKLSNKPGALPEELHIAHLLDRDLNEQHEALRQVQDHVGFVFIDESVWQNLHGSRDIAPLLQRINALAGQGFFDNLNLDDAAFWSADRRDGVPARAPSLNDLLIALAGVDATQQVYVPWEASGQLAARVARCGAHAWIEAQMPMLTAQLLILSGSAQWTLKANDPITNPSALERGKLIRFDTAVCHPPMGLRYSHEVVEGDLLGRFVEKTPVGSVLQIRHLLAQTRGRIVMAVANGVLFASGSERQLRERLVEAGQLEAVIALPAGLCSHTGIPLSILVLNAQGGAESVRFVSAATEAFTERAAKKRIELKNIDTLLAEIAGRDTTDHAVSVSRQAIADNDYSLEVGRYVLDEAARQLEHVLQRYEMRKLSEFFEVIRPRQHATSASGAEVFEVQAQDIPAYGYICSASKEALFDLGSAKVSTYFIRPDDVLMTFKGTIGKTGIAQDVPDSEEGGWIAGQSLTILRSKRPDMYPPKALLTYLRSDMGQALLRHIAVGATIPSIQLSALKELEIPVPSADEMNRMVQAFELETQIEEQIQQLRTKQAAIAASLWTA